MAQNIKPSPAELEQQIAARRGDIETCRKRRGEALAAGRQDEADDWTREIERHRLLIEGLEDTVQTVHEADADAASAAADRDAAKQRRQFMAAARECRKLAVAEDEQLTGVVTARRALREGLARLWEAATGPQRTAELEGLVAAINSLPVIAIERLAHGDVVPSRMPLLDRSAPAPSVRDHLDKVLDLIAPAPGRPPKVSEPTPEPQPATAQDGHSDGGAGDVPGDELKQEAA